MEIEELYAQYSGELTRWAVRLTGSWQTGEDLAQETFLRALAQTELLQNLDERRARAWLYRVARNLNTDRLRRRKREVISPDAPDTSCFASEMSEAEWQMLINALPGDEGPLFVMRYLEGYDSRQLGEMFGMPPGTVRCKLSQARKRLKDMLKG